ncbi:MAG: dTDP-4-dehydrorhamnose reductase [Pirellulales bacterium]
MKIAVTGAQGQLGWELCRQLGDQALPLDRGRLDVTDRAAVLETLRELRPTAVVNAAAYTAVDRAEQEPEVALRGNADAVEYLAEACRQLDCPLVQVSTDYAFGGDDRAGRPFTETDPIAPQGQYAKSKMEGERRAAAWGKHFIVRTCGLYGKAAPGRKPNNFVETMLRLGPERDVLKIVTDQRCTPTYVVDLAEAIRFLLSTDRFGLYHVVNSGSCTWFEFAETIFRLANIKVRLEPITAAQYGAPAPRPAYSVLDTSKYQALGGPPLRDWQSALAAYLQSRE